MSRAVASWHDVTWCSMIRLIRRAQWPDAHSDRSADLPHGGSSGCRDSIRHHRDDNYIYIYNYRYIQRLSRKSLSWYKQKYIVVDYISNETRARDTFVCLHNTLLLFIVFYRSVMLVCVQTRAGIVTSVLYLDISPIVFWHSKLIISKFLAWLYISFIGISNIFVLLHNTLHWSDMHILHSHID